LYRNAAAAARLVAGARENGFIVVADNPRFVRRSLTYTT
jgi:hypothetical protein